MCRVVGNEGRVHWKSLFAIPLGCMQRFRQLEAAYLAAPHAPLQISQTEGSLPLGEVFEDQWILQTQALAFSLVLEALGREEELGELPKDEKG